MKKDSNSQAQKQLRKPLEEAWMSIRWKLKEIQPGFQKDEAFPIALGNFAYQVKEKFPERVAKKASDVPVELLAYVPRYQFRKGESSGWPLVQLGAGIATLNYTTTYSWSSFLNDALFLREKLLAAYEGTRLVPEAISLKYRNSFPYDYKQSDLQTFLKSKLNFNIQMPKGIPGNMAAKPNIIGINYSSIYDIKSPIAQGILTLATGYKTVKDNHGKEQKKEYLINDIEIVSKTENAPDYYNQVVFKKWLEEAHLVASQWFSSLMEEANAN